MWMRTILLLILTKLSEEACKVEMDRGRYDLEMYDLEMYDGASYRPYPRVVCTNINPNDELQTLLPHDDYDDSYFAYNNLFLTNSKIPELTNKMWSSIDFHTITIQANVEVIQSNAFNNGKVIILKLDYNRIRKIEDMGFSSSLLENLSLQNNSLSAIKANNFKGLLALRKLNLKRNNISQIEEDSFDDLEHLQVLDLSFNKLVELHVGQFKNLSHLRAIYLNNNLLKELNDHIFSDCRALRFVNIENNFLTIIDIRSHSDSILFVNASNNQLISVAFSNLTNVETIDLKHNHLQSTVSSLRNFTKMENLNRLDLSYNNLTEIRYDTFENSAKLLALWLEYNFISSIELGGFRNLENLLRLNLTHNKIKNLKIGDLPSLKYLYLSYNQLGPSINFYKMQNLEELDLAYNNIEEIRYDSFDNTTELEHLSLQYNSIRSLEMGCFKNLENLTQLNLSHNKIKSFEFGMFSGLYGLITLDISYNKLSQIDKNTFHNNRDLKNLNIAYNNLKGMEIKNMRSRTVSLGRITLTGTEWSCHSLADFFRNDIIVTRGTFHNESNISGIPCNNTDDDNNRHPNEVQSPGSLSEFQKYLKSKEKQESYKMSVIIVALIALFIMFSVKFVFAKCSSRFTAGKVFISQESRDEQEMQLI